LDDYADGLAHRRLLRRTNTAIFVKKACDFPIAQFPDIVPPQVTLTATYPGKDPEVIETTVAQPIEQGV
jgi:Cu/Ag efflux pump CusA